MYYGNEPQMFIPKIYIVYTYILALHIKFCMNVSYNNNNLRISLTQSLYRIKNKILYEYYISNIVFVNII